MDYSCRAHEKCLYCCELESTWKSLQLCDGVRSQTIQVRKLGSWLRRYVKQSNACQYALRNCIEILAMFSFGQEGTADSLGFCLPLANSVQTVALHIMEQLGILHPSFYSWSQIMQYCVEYSKEQPTQVHFSNIASKKLSQLVQKVVGYVKFRSPEASLFHSVLSSFPHFSSLLWSQEDTHHLPLKGSDMPLISVIVYEISSRRVILYPLYREEQDFASTDEQHISLYENECCMLWFSFILLSWDVLQEYHSVFYENSLPWNSSRFFSGASLPDSNNCIESAMKLLRHCFWIVLSGHPKFHVDAIITFINRIDEVRMVFSALLSKLEWFLSQERNPRDSVLAASFSWVCLLSQFWQLQDENEKLACLNQNKGGFISLEDFEMWMKSDLPKFSKLSICVAIIECYDYPNMSWHKLYFEKDLEVGKSESVSFLIAIFETLKGFCRLGEDSHFHFMSLDALRRCISKFIDHSMMSADLIREVLQILWQRCQEPIRGFANQINNIIQELLSLSSDSRVPVKEQERMQFFWNEFYQSLLSSTISTKAQFVIIESLLSFMGGSSHLLEVSPNFPKQALLALSTDQSCSTAAAHCLETFWKFLLEEIGERSFIEKTGQHLLESILEATSVLQEERLISQALGVYLKLSKDRKYCLLCLLNLIPQIAKDYWQITRLKLIVVSNGRNLCPDFEVDYGVSDKELTVLMEEFNLALSSQDETCRFAVIECLCSFSYKVGRLDSSETHLFLRLMPWFLYESKPSASWRFLHIVSRFLKRLKHSINTDIRTKQISFLQWERTLLQDKESNLPQVDILLIQAVELLERIHLLLFDHLVVSDINTFRQQNASRLLREWMLVCLDRESMISPVLMKLTRQLLYSYYISMLNGSEKLVKSISELLSFYNLDLSEMYLSLDWIFKVSFYHLKSIRSSHAECGAQIIKLIFNSFVKSNGYYFAEWRNDEVVEGTQDNFCISRLLNTDPALASFYFFSWFLNMTKAKFGSSVVANEDDWLFGYFIVCQKLFQVGWMPESWLKFYSVETIRNKIINPLMAMLSSCVMESLKGVGYVEPWIGVYLQVILKASNNASLTKTYEKDSCFQRKLIVGSFHCLKEVCSLITVIIQTVCDEQRPVERKRSKAQPSYVSKGLRRMGKNTNIANQLWTIQDIEYLFSLQIEVICCTTHSGVMECVGDALLQTSNILFRSCQSEWSDLPRKKLFQVLSEISNSKFYSLRRSAGLPYFIRAVCLAAEQARLKDITPTVLQELVERLERFVDENIVDSYDDGSTLPVFPTNASVIHCMNILHFVLQDGNLSDVTTNFAEQCFIFARRVYASPNWSIRNSAMLLAGAALRRILKISGEARERDYCQFILPVDSVVLPSVQVENETLLTFGELFGKLFPHLFSHISVSLQQIQNEILRSDIGSSQNCDVASIYPILCLLSTLRNSSNNSSVHTIRANLEKTNPIWNLTKRPPHPFCSSHELQLLPSLIEILVVFLQIRQQFIRFSAGNCICRMVRATPWSLQLFVSLLESLPVIPCIWLSNTVPTADRVTSKRISCNVIRLKFSNSQHRSFGYYPLRVEYSSLGMKGNDDSFCKQFVVPFSHISTTEEPELSLCSVADIYLALPKWSRGCRIRCDFTNHPIMDVSYDNEKVLFHYNNAVSLPCDFQVTSLASIQNMLQGKLFTCIKLFEENVFYWMETLSCKEWLKVLDRFVIEYLSWIAVSVSVPALTRSMWFTWMNSFLMKFRESKAIQRDDIGQQLYERIHNNSIDWIFQILVLEYQDSVAREHSYADGLRLGQTQLVIECLRLLKALDEKWLFSLDTASSLSFLSMNDNYDYHRRFEELLIRLPSLLDNSCLQVQREIVLVFEKWSKCWLSEGCLERYVVKNVLKEFGIRLEEIFIGNHSPNDLLASVFHFYRSVMTHILSMLTINRTDCVVSCPEKSFLECISSRFSNWNDEREVKWIDLLLFRTKQIIDQNFSYTVLEEAFPLYAVILEFQDAYCSTLIIAEQKTRFKQDWLSEIDCFLGYVEANNPQMHPVPFRMAILDSLYSIGCVVFQTIYEQIHLESCDNMNEVVSDSDSDLKSIWVRFCLCMMHFLQDEYPDVRNRAATKLYDILNVKYEFPKYSPNWFQALKWIFEKCFSLEYIFLHNEKSGSRICDSLVSYLRKTLFLSFQVIDNSSEHNSEHVMYETHPSNVVEKVLSQWQNYFESASTELFDSDPNNSFEEPLLQMQHVSVLCRTILVSSYGKSYHIWRRRSFGISINRLCFLLNWVLYMEKREMIGFLPEFFRPVYILLLHLYVLDEGHVAYKNNELGIQNAIHYLQKLSNNERLTDKIHKCLAEYLKNFLNWHFGEAHSEAPQELLFLLGKTC